MKASASRALAVSVIFTTLVSLAAPAWAQSAPAGGSGGKPTPVVGPGPEMSAGVLGMTLAVGVIYFIKRRNRDLI
jgi:hypothetical protein